MFKESIDPEGVVKEKRPSGFIRGIDPVGGPQFVATKNPVGNGGGFNKKRDPIGGRFTKGVDP